MQWKYHGDTVMVYFLYASQHFDGKSVAHQTWECTRFLSSQLMQIGCPRERNIADETMKPTHILTDMMCDFTKKMVRFLKHLDTKKNTAFGLFACYIFGFPFLIFPKFQNDSADHGCSVRKFLCLSLNGCAHVCLLTFPL